MHPGKEFQPVKSPKPTKGELKVIELLAQRNSVKEIATILGRSFKTVDAHKYNVMRKLNVHSTRQLVWYAIQQGFIKDPRTTEKKGGNG